jgi:hypothetical protein
VRKSRGPHLRQARRDSVVEREKMNTCLSGLPPSSLFILFRHIPDWTVQHCEQVFIPLVNPFWKRLHRHNPEVCFINLLGAFQSTHGLQPSLTITRVICGILQFDPGSRDASDYSVLI